jgi:DNA-binding transcriptional ArsR family regulator
MNLYPRHPGSKQPVDTSAAAASAAAPESEALRAACLSTLRGSELTADEIAERLGRSVLSVRPRVTELKRLGCVEDTGLRRKNVSGKSAAVVRAKASRVDVQFAKAANFNIQTSFL